MFFLRWLRPLLRLFFKLLYGRMAWTYDAVAAVVSLGRWQKWILSVIPYLVGSRVLELGHGPGHLQAALLAEGKQVVGLDASPQMGRIALRRLRLLQKQPSLSEVDRNQSAPQLARGVTQALPFPPESFDQVVSTFPSEYIADQHTLEEIWRVLKPGGKAVILLGAWITRKRPADQGAAWLFKVTGQAPEWNDRYLEPLKRVGFEPAVEWIEDQGSKILIILANKNIELANRL